MRKTFLYGTLILVLVLVLSFLYIALKTFSKETVQSVLSLKRRYLLLSLFLLFLYHTFDNLRLFFLSRAVGLRYSLLYGYVMSFVNTFGATVTPAHIGGEAAAVYMLLRKGASLHKVMSIVTMKAVSGGVFFLLCLPLFVYYLHEHPAEAVRVLKVLGAVLFVSVSVYFAFDLLVRRNLRRADLRKFRESLKRYVNYLRIFGYKRKGYLFLSILSSLLLYACFLLFAPVLVLSFGAEADFVKLVFDQIVLLYALFISPTPGGSGVGEIGGLAVFRGHLQPYEIGVFVILWRVISQYMSAFIGGVLFLVCLLKDLRR
ncbi:MAG: flippase-like domain-containing protein [Aquificota bacterium]|nr:flippase-like domain-containing protein [Aquificota bacterium]